LRELCTERGALLMIDEVQTGFGRTGRWFGFQHAGIVPDVVTMAKAMGNGFPVGAVWAPIPVAAAFEPGDHGSTYSATALAAAVVRAVIAELRRIDAPRLATERGAHLAAALAGVDGVAHVRGHGLLLAAELAPGIESAGVYARALQAGLVVNAVTPTAIRFAPPINVSPAELDEAVAIFAGAVAA
jgi:acetylornithine/succinyldiaminopimelate/putrescine aminotransferase